MNENLDSTFGSPVLSKMKASHSKMGNGLCTYGSSATRKPNRLFYDENILGDGDDDDEPEEESNQSREYGDEFSDQDDIDEPNSPLKLDDVSDDGRMEELPEDQTIGDDSDREPGTPSNQRKIQITDKRSRSKATSQKQSRQRKRFTARREEGESETDFRRKEEETRTAMT